MSASPLAYFSNNIKLLAVFAISDYVKEDSIDAIKELMREKVHQLEDASCKINETFANIEI